MRDESTSSGDPGAAAAEPEVEAPTQDGANISAQDASLVSLRGKPPTVLPAVMQRDLVPFPGPVIPITLSSPERRRAVVQARRDRGFFMLCNYSVPESTEENAEAELSDFAAMVAEAFSPGEPYSPEDMFAEDEHPGNGSPGPNEQPENAEYHDLDADSGHHNHPDHRDHDTDELGTAAGPQPKGHRNRRGDDHGDGVAPHKLEGLHDIARVGILARVAKVFKLPDGKRSCLVHLVRRGVLLDLDDSGDVPMVKVEYPGEIVSDQEQFEAVYRQLRYTMRQFFEVHPHLPDEVKATAMALEDPGLLADFAAQHLSRDYNERLGFLLEMDVGQRLYRALEVAIRELDMLTVGNRISQEIREKVEKHQRDFLLREQLKAIRAELGEEKDATTVAVEELSQKLDEAGLPEHARERADDELKRLSLVPAESPEHNIVRTYLELIAGLPWSTLSEEIRDIAHARAVLDEDHYGLKEVKDRIIEFLAVRQLNPDSTGTLLCFAGPPGKTSLGQSIARALGRPFYRFSVGGMRDEAEIKGHRRTYVGAMPGRILQSLRQMKVANPVLMIDELDKMGADWRGDPSSAMLEVLDPAQNQSFLDHYLDLPFDLSRVMFIATANVKANIPSALRDRLEVIDLPGYIPDEKLQIARRYLVPRQLKEHGLKRGQLRIGDGALRRIIRDYTMEAGVRELDRAIARVNRKRATEVVQDMEIRPQVAAKDLESHLGLPKQRDDRLTRARLPGVATGLAWTAAGGTVLFIEVARMRGKGNVKVTGQLGEVMTESTTIAFSYVRKSAARLGLDESIFGDYDVHLHFPAGAVPKDGPSAGITITTALISLFCATPIQVKLAMTGEISLGGEVLPVGGVREKTIAARAAGIKTVIVPERNRPDIEEIPAEVTKGVSFVFASHYDDVLPVAFPKGVGKAKKNPTARQRGATSR